MLIMFIEQTRAETTAKVAKVPKVPRQKLPHTKSSMTFNETQNARASAQAAGKEKTLHLILHEGRFKNTLAACRSGRQLVSHSVRQSVSQIVGENHLALALSAPQRHSVFALTLGVAGLSHTHNHTHTHGLGWVPVRANLTCVEVLNG